MAYLVSDFLNDVRREGMLPATSSDGTADSDILAQGQIELETRVVPLILRVREEYFNTIQDQTIEVSRSRYRLPRRAVGGAVRNVTMVRSDGTEKRLFHFELEYIKKYYSTITPGEPDGYYFRGDDVVLVPTPNITGCKLRIEFPTRPGRMTALTSNQYCTLDGSTQWVDNGGLTWEIEAIGSIAGSGSARPIDLFRADNGFQYFAVDVQATISLDTGVNTVSISQASVPELQYWVPPANAGQTYIIALANYIHHVPVPVEFQSFLVQCTVARMKRQLGELEQSAFHEGVVQKMAADIIAAVVPRDDGEPRKVLGGVLWSMKRPWWNNFLR